MKIPYYWFLILFFILLSIGLLFYFKNMNKNIREPAVAGQFYPAKADILQKEINGYLNKVKMVENSGIKALISPHAGYSFSGLVAASGYKNLVNQKINRVIILGNSHQHYFSGVAIDDHDYWQTPLGKVNIDRELAKKLTEISPLIKFNSTPHDLEHSLEVQVPFLQTVIENDFTIVPILFGNTSQTESKLLAQALKDNLDPGDLIIVSTDLSHYLPTEQAEKIDQETLESILSKDMPEGDNKLCGSDAVKTVLFLAQELNWSAELLKYSHSGQVIGDNQKVVGYGSILFSNQIENELNSEQQQELLKIARQTVEQYILKGKTFEPEIKDQRFQEINGAFVTLHNKGQLRGCIGNIIGQGPLGETVRDMAIAAATEDNRFLPVTEDELDSLDYEISVLSPPQKVSDWKKIELGRHGVVVKKGLRSGVFLPQVATDTGWSLEEFLNHLCVDKAGLALDCYKNDPTIELYTFTAQVFD